MIGNHLWFLAPKYNLNQNLSSSQMFGSLLGLISRPIHPSSDNCQWQSRPYRFNSPKLTHMWFNEIDISFWSLILRNISRRDSQICVLTDTHFLNYTRSLVVLCWWGQYWCMLFNPKITKWGDLVIHRGRPGLKVGLRITPFSFPFTTTFTFPKRRRWEVKIT